jgi:hypothetical protein
MKRAALLALLLLVVAAPAHSQIQEIGFKLGVNSSKLGGEDITDNDMRTASAFGAFLIFPLSSFDLQAELLIMNKGSAFAEGGWEETLSARYLEIPVLARFEFGHHGAALRPHASIGPAVGFLMSCTYVEQVGGQRTSLKCDEDGNPANSVDVGLVVGGGLSYALGIGRVLVDARYSHGLRNMWPEYSGIHRTFSLMAGYSVPLNSTRR